MHITNLHKRIFSSLIMIPAAIYIIHFGEWLYLLCTIMITLFMLYEWIVMLCGFIKKQDTENMKIPTIQFNSKTVSKKNTIWKFARNTELLLLGIAYTGIFCWGILTIRSADNGLILTLWVVAVVSCTDIGGYFLGSKIGGPKIAPQISPSKTWSGLFGGITLAFIASMIFYKLFNGSLIIIIMSPIMSSIAQAGDFIESYFKRKFGVKDSGNIIPGHGGVMDRMDGYITTAPFIALLSNIYNVTLFN